MKILEKLPKERKDQAKALFGVITVGALIIIVAKGFIWFWNVLPF